MKVTGRGIPDPDLIYAGQVLLIPIPPRGGAAQVPSSRTAPVVIHLYRPPAVPRPRLRQLAVDLVPSRALPNISSPISIKYRLDDLKFPPIVQPGIIISIRFTGDVLLMTKKSYAAVYVTHAPRSKCR